MMPVHLKDFLDSKVKEYNHPAFIKDDPISIPHFLQKNKILKSQGSLPLYLPGETGQRLFKRVKN